MLKLDKLATPGAFHAPWTSFGKQNANIYYTTPRI